MAVKVHTLRELRALSPEDMRSLSYYLREWAEEKGTGTETGADHGDPEEVTVAYCEEVREKLRTLDIMARDWIIKRLRQDIIDDMVASHEAAEGESIAPDFRALTIRNLEEITDPELLEGIYYGTETSKREQRRREEAAKDGR